MRWRRIARKPWKLAATAISPNRASHGRSSQKCNGSSGRVMEAPREQPQSPPEAEPARILIVDDHEDNVELLRARLEAWGYTAESAADGAEALKKIEESPPDLVLLDVMMPKIDGIEVAKRVKGNPHLPFIPIIMQTA